MTLTTGSVVPGVLGSESGPFLPSTLLASICLIWRLIPLMTRSDGQL